MFIKRMKSFVRETKARLKGDTNTVIAEKNHRKATAGIKQQIAALEASLIDAEGQVEESEEALAAAKYPTELITDSKSYLQGIKAAETRLEGHKDTVEDIKASIKYYKALQEGFDHEVEGGSTDEKA